MPSIKFSTYLLNRIPKFISKCFLNCGLNLENFLEGHFEPPRKMTFPGYILNSLLSVSKFVAKDKFVWAEQCVGLAPPPPSLPHTHQFSKLNPSSGSCILLSDVSIYSDFENPSAKQLGGTPKFENFTIHEIV